MPSLRGIIAIAVPAVTALLGLFWYLGRKKATDKNPPDKSDPCVTKHLVKLPDPATVPCGKTDADSLRLQPNQVEEDKSLGFQDAEGNASLVSQDAEDEILRDIEDEVLSDLADEMKVIELQIIRPSFVVSSQTTFERQFQIETHETPEPSEPEQIEEVIGPKGAASVSCVLPSLRDFQSQKCYSIENLEESENYNASNNTSSSSTLQDNKSIEQLNSQNDAACDESASKLWHENIPEDLTYTTLVGNGIEQLPSEQSMHNEQNYVQDAKDPVCLSSSAGEGGVSDSQSNGCCSPSNGQNSASPIQKKDTQSDSSNNCDNFSEVSNDSGTGHSDHGNISPPDEHRLFEFNIPANMCGLLIGKRGNTVRDISQKSGTRIQVQNNPYNHKMKICVIEGTAVGIETACSIIKAKFPKLHFPSPHMAPSPKNPVLIPEIMQVISEGPKRQKWSHFLCVEIRNEKLKKELMKVQDWIERRYPQYSEFRIPSCDFHITLEVLSLPEDSDVRLCVSILDSIKEDIASNMFMCSEIMLEGIGLFRDRVIFASITLPEHFSTTREIIQQALVKSKIRFENKNMKKFIPHMTLFKVKDSPDWKLAERLNLHEFLSTKFGFQSYDNVQLCEMGERSNEFYKTVWGYWE